MIMQKSKGNNNAEIKRKKRKITEIYMNKRKDIEQTGWFYTMSKRVILRRTFATEIIKDILTCLQMNETITAQSAFGAGGHLKEALGSGPITVELDYLTKKGKLVLENQMLFNYEAKRNMDTP